MLRFYLIAIAGTGLAAPALASDAPIYRPAPGWTEQADVDAASARTKGPVVVYDLQQWVEGGEITAYVDQAFRIERPEALSQFGTLAAVWMPDKGDLIVHRAELRRAGEVVDLLKDGKFEVLRREQQLEQRTMTGILTASMTVQGARVGDIVRFSYSVTSTDAALKGQVQRLDMLPAGPIQIGTGRLRASWPKDRKIGLAIQPGMPLPKVSQVGSMQRIEIPLPIAKPPEMPDDAPLRYLQPPIFSLSSFTDWKDVSRTMAPLFATEGTVAPEGPIAAEVRQIRAAGGGPRTQAVAALKVVQDRIGYFANGMAGGNYVPQSPEQTWNTRFGDCKAKSLLLLAMLRELGISSQAILVRSRGGDAIGAALPMAAAFDHVVVMAEIEGQRLLLDGTGFGASAENLGDAPNFYFGLPLPGEGAELLALQPRAPQQAQTTVSATYDQSYGVDFPQLIEARIEQRGPAAAWWKSVSALAEGEDRNAMIDSLGAGMLGDFEVIERNLVVDEATGTVAVTFKGFQNSAWNRDQRRAVLAPANLTSSISFSPDRSRASWQQIPVNLGDNGRIKRQFTYILPDGGRGYELQGGGFKGEVAGSMIQREVKLENGRLIVSEDNAWRGGELPVAAIPVERLKAETFKGSAVRVRAPTDVLRRWQVRTAADRAALKPLVDAYDRQIAAKPDEAGRWLGRGSFYAGINDHDLARRDFDRAIKLDASADNFVARAALAEDTGQFAAAVADFTQAWEIDPTPYRLAALAIVLGKNGQAQTGIDRIDAAIDSAGDGKAILQLARAELLARTGRKAEGLAELDRLLEERPGDVTVLNSRCWYRGAWNVALDQARADCNSALQGSEFAPAILDSRAMVLFRLGEYKEALADIDAALTHAGWQAQTLFLRGAIRKKTGDSGGAADVAEALRRSPGLQQEYADYGILP